MKEEKNHKPEKNYKQEKNRYDNAWKDIIRDLFFEFLDFYYPDLSREVDHKVPPRSREKELAKLLPANQEKSRTADLLYRVGMKNGKVRSLLLHIEVQNRKEEELARRLFQYAYRIFDREGSFPVTLLLLTDGDPTFCPTGYRMELAGGCYLSLDFLTRKLLYLKHDLGDYGRECVPGSGIGKQNPFAFVTAAHLDVLKARKPGQQYRLKLDLTRRLVEQGWDSAYASSLLRFLDWMLQLPEDLEELYDRDTKTILEEDKMPYVTSWERRALKKGMELGLDQGIEQGIEKGIEQGIEKGIGKGELRGKQGFLCRLMEKKFGGSVSEKEAFERTVEKIEDEALLDQAIDAILEADSREDVLTVMVKQGH